MKTYSLLTGLLFTCFLLAAQAGDLKRLEEDIAYHADIMLHAEESLHRIRAHDQLLLAMDTFLSLPGSYHAGLDSIPWLQTLKADDFRIVTWQLKVSADEYMYGGFIQWPDRVVRLMDTRPFINGSSYAYYTADKWYGCLYYQLMPFDHDGRRYYLLMGFHAENGLVNTKLADVLDLTGDMPRLGLPVFTGQGDPRTRMMLTYADGSNVQMRYDSELKGIVHDHLVRIPGIGPSGETLPVSDGSLEGWLLKKGYWEYEEEVYKVKPVSEPPMMPDRKERKEGRDILGRPRGS